MKRLMILTAVLAIGGCGVPAALIVTPTDW